MAAQGMLPFRRLRTLEPGRIAQAQPITPPKFATPWHCQECGSHFRTAQALHGHRTSKQHLAKVALHNKSPVCRSSSSLSESLQRNAASSESLGASQGTIASSSDSHPGAEERVRLAEDITDTCRADTEAKTHSRGPSPTAS